MSCPAVIRVTTQSGPPGIGLPAGTADPGKFVRKAGVIPYAYELVTPDQVSTASYTFNQTTPATTWTINHNLGFFPSVELLNSGLQEIDGEISHTNINQTIVIVHPATAGLALLK